MTSGNPAFLLVAKVFGYFDTNLSYCSKICVKFRVARSSLPYQLYQNGGHVPNDQKMYQTALKPSGNTGKTAVAEFREHGFTASAPLAYSRGELA
jgi:hypothetical protein